VRSAKFPPHAMSLENPLHGAGPMYPVQFQPHERMDIPQPHRDRLTPTAPGVIQYRRPSTSRFR